jgi:hypothetical protein
MNTKKKTFKFFLSAAAFLLLLIHHANAQEFSATVSSPSVDVGEQFQITFTLNSTGKNFRPPTFIDFNVLMGPNQSTQMQIINGSVSQTISFTYVLQAVKEGTFKIGSAEITVGSNKVQSNPVTVIVSKASNHQQAGSQKQGGNNSGGGDASKNVFIRASVDKNSAYQGEGIAVIYRLYTKVSLLNYSVNKIPAFNGFWSQEITMPQQLEFHRENYDGVTYNVADLKKVILFPQHPGTLNIDPMEVDVVARVQVRRQQQQSNDPFSQFFNDPFFNNNLQDIKVPLKSDVIKINVRDLPSGAPQAFTGAVGKFAYEVSMDKNQVKAHDAVTLKIKISGKGNIKLIDAPKIEFPPDFETYDPKENVSANATNNGVTGTKTFEYLIIPRNPGNFKIDVAPFSFFDLEKKQYITQQSPLLNLHVERGSDNATTVISGVNKTDVQMLGKDIRFIKTKDPVFIHPGRMLFNSPVFYSLLAAPALIFAGLLFVRRRNETMAGNMKLVRSQRANKVAMKRLSAAQKYMKENNREKFLDEMFRALWGFISDKLQIPVSDLSKDTASQALLSRKVPENLVLQFTDTIDSCEFARFAGGVADSNEVIYKKGIDVITQLENTIG